MFFLSGPKHWRDFKHETKSQTCIEQQLGLLLQSTMGQARLNHVAILKYHKTLSRSRNLETIADQFIKLTAIRGNTFLIKN